MCGTACRTLERTRHNDMTQCIHTMAAAESSVPSSATWLPKRALEWQDYFEELHNGLPDRPFRWRTFMAHCIVWLSSQLLEVPCVALDNQTDQSRLQVSRLSKVPSVEEGEYVWPDATVQAFMAASACAKAAALMRKSIKGKGDLHLLHKAQWLERMAQYLLVSAEIHIQLSDDGADKVLDLQRLQSAHKSNERLSFVPCQGDAQDFAFPHGARCCMGDPLVTARQPGTLRELHDELMRVPKDASADHDLVRMWCREVRWQCGLPPAPVWWFGAPEHGWFPTGIRLNVIRADPDNDADICIRSRWVKLWNRFEGKTAQDIVDMALSWPPTVDWLVRVGFKGYRSWIHVPETCVFRPRPLRQITPADFPDVRQVILESDTALVLMDIQWRVETRPKPFLVAARDFLGW